jgi:hypothetical protein
VTQWMARSRRRKEKEKAVSRELAVETHRPPAGECAAEADGEYVECVSSDASTRERSRRNGAKDNGVISDHEATSRRARS